MASAAIGMRPVRRGASHAIASRSERTSSAICGRCTFTTTCSPVRSRAACTCAIDAAAIGVRSKLTKTSSSERPSSISTTRRTRSKSSAGTRSRSSLNSVDELLGEQPLAAGDDLAELDVGGPEAAEGDAQAPGDRLLRLAVPPLRRSSSEPRAERVADLADDAREPAERREVAGLEPLRHLCRPPAGAAGRRRRARSWPRDRRPTGRRR